MITLYPLLLQQAETAIEKAREELRRPSEDVVAFSVCNNASNATRWLLCSYLEKHGIAYSRTGSLPDLIRLCTGHNQDFKSFNFSNFSCLASVPGSENYCLDIQKVTECFNIALSLRDYLVNEPEESK